MSILEDLKEKGLKELSYSSEFAFSGPTYLFFGIMGKIDLDLSSLLESKMK
jgi:hypothetical protein